jgi:cytoskeletal protein CcmA (bactofilin family)
MWRKDEGAPEPPSTPSEAASGSARSTRASGTGEHAILGRSIAIRGDVTGEEDLTIQGRVEGSVTLREHSVTVGPDGEIRASIVARVITVEGQVEGNLSADEQVFLRRSARVRGDIVSPRVALEDGARFLGSVDMGETSTQDRKEGPPRTAPAAKASIVGSETAAPPRGASADAPHDAKKAGAESRIKTG